MLTDLGTRRARLLAILLLVTALTAGCYAGNASDLPTGGINRQLFELVNTDRAANGLPGLQWDSQLGGLAQEWSQQMASTRTFRHRDLNEVINRAEYAPYDRLGENILVGGCGISPEEIERAWMNSPGHRANILGNYNTIGIGTVCQDRRLWATQNFGLR
ncbi:MAG TPA: CAP domain-containing protein [Acidimicrobiia bacterium]